MCSASQPSSGLSSSEAAHAARARCQRQISGTMESVPVLQANAATIESKVTSAYSTLLRRAIRLGPIQLQCYHAYMGIAVRRHQILRWPHEGRQLAEKRSETRNDAEGSSRPLHKQWGSTPFDVLQAHMGKSLEDVGVGLQA